MFNQSKNSKVLISMRTLSESFIQLLNAHSFDEITIKDVCERSGYSRKTFYRNFETKEDLFDYYIYQFLDINDIDEVKNQSVREYMHFFFSVFENEKMLLKVCFKNNLYFLFFKRLYISISDVLIKENNPYYMNMTITKEYYLKVLIAEIVEMLEVWTDRNFKETVNELVDVYIQMSNRTIRELSK